MKPAANSTAGLHIRRPSRQHEKHRLQRVLRKVGVADHPTTDGQDHRSVSAHESGERFLIPIRDEPREKLVVGQACDGNTTCRDSKKHR